MAQAPSGRPERAAGPAARLTGRGAVLAMAGVYLIGVLAASWLGWTALAGLGFVAGSGLAVWYVKPAELFTVVVSPPLLFLGAVLLVTALTDPGGLVLSVVDSVATLAGAAPWLAIGLVLTVIIAWARGLPQCLRDLRQALRDNPLFERRKPVAAPDGRRPGTARPRRRPGTAQSGRRPAAAQPGRRPGSVQTGRRPGPAQPGRRPGASQAGGQPGPEQSGEPGQPAVRQAR